MLARPVRVPSQLLRPACPQNLTQLLDGDQTAPVMEHPVTIGADHCEILKVRDTFPNGPRKQFSVMDLAETFSQRPINLPKIELAHLTRNCAQESLDISLFRFNELTTPSQP